MQVALAFTPPLPRAISTSPTPTPSRPGRAESAMCPAMTMIAEMNSVRSAPSSRSEIQANKIVER